MDLAALLCGYDISAWPSDCQLFPIRWNTFNYAPVGLGVALTLILLWWVLDATDYSSDIDDNLLNDPAE